MEWINKVLLYSTGNYTQYPVINHFGKEYGFPGRTVVKNPPAKTRDIGDSGLIPESGRSPGGGNGNPFQYAYLDNPMKRGAWWTTVHGVAKSWR